MIRLGIRVRTADAEIAFARLEPVLAAGAEEIDLDDEDAVEFAVYGDSLPSDEVLRSLAGETILEVNRSPVEGDWASAWQHHLAPVIAGAFTIRPPWIDGDPSDLVIDPGPSFGAASHPTTRLCLELLQRLEGRGPLADWGTGSGVLAIAGAQLGFAPVLAVELDPAAAHTARRNAARNGVGVQVEVGDVTRDAPWATTVVANLTLPLLEAAASAATARAAASDRAARAARAAASDRAARAAVSDRAAPPGAAGALPPARLVASGVLASHADAAMAAWSPLGFAERERLELDGWAAVVLERA